MTETTKEDLQSAIIHTRRQNDELRTTLRDYLFEMKPMQLEFLTLSLQVQMNKQTNCNFSELKVLTSTMAFLQMCEFMEEFYQSKLEERT